MVEAPVEQADSTPVPMPIAKLTGFDLWKLAFRGAKYVVAPMVDQSALAWRMLCRKHGAQLCYTPMFHSKVFAEQEAYRAREWATCSEDRPLVVQFCGNDPETLLAAAKLVENDCDAVDINLGCPQGIAKKGFYGSYLQDEWDLISRMVGILHKNLRVPVTCKIRIFPEVEKTIRYAKMLQEAGCQLLTVHGRIREQKQQATGLADWDQIKAVKEALDIPVFANGNILYHEDIEDCLEYTGVEGVMTAEGNLYNPFIFEPGRHLNFVAAREYMEMVRRHDAITSHARGHLFKIFAPAISVHPDLRTSLGNATGIEEILQSGEALCKAVEADYAKAKAEADPCINDMTRHWFCQPHLRSLAAPLPTKHSKRPQCHGDESLEPSAKQPKTMH